LTAAVDNGGLQKFGEITKPQRGAKKARDSISLHTCISEEVQAQKKAQRNRQTLLLLKKKKPGR
jgi:hypothetical protein